MRLPRILLAMLATFALVVGFMPTAHADDTTATLGSGNSDEYWEKAHTRY